MDGEVTASSLKREEPGFWRRSGSSAFCLVALVLLGLGLRAVRLAYQPLWWDEGYSVWFATHSLGEIAALTAQDIHPPLYYALLHGWTLLLGAGPVALRLCSVAAGLLAIPAMYIAGRRLLSRRAAWLAVLLLAINPLHIFYSQEVRMYGLMALLSTGILLAAFEAFRALEQEEDTAPTGRGSRARDGRKRVPPVLVPLVLYVLLVAAALYTQYFAAFIPIGLAFYAVWRFRRNRSALAVWFGAQAAVAGLFLPWVLYAAPKLVPYVSQKVVQDADRPLGLPVYVARHLAAYLAGHLEGTLALYWPAALLLVLPLLAGVWMANPARPLRSHIAPELHLTRRGTQNAICSTRHAVPMLTAVLATALCLGWLVGLRYPFFPERGERLLLLGLPPFLLLVAASLDSWWERSRLAAYALVAAVILLSGASLLGFFTVPRYASEDYRPLIARTVEQGLPEDTVFCVYPWQVGYWRSYGHSNGPNAILTPDAAWSPAVADTLDAALRQGRVWFPAHLALGAVLETEIEGHLATAAAPFANEWYGRGTRLSAWARTGAAEQLDFAGIRFPLRGSGAGAAVLRGVAVSKHPLPASNAVMPLTLRWTADGSLPVLGVSVRLTDALGQIWAQHDYEPLGGLTPLPAGRSLSPGGDTTRAGRQAEDLLGLLVPAGTPPGRYAVEVAVLRKGDPRPLDAFTLDGHFLGTAVRLLEVTVVAADRVLGPERLPIASRRNVSLGDGLQFLGYTADEAPLAPGELRKVSLFWQATVQPAADYVAFLQLLDTRGSVAAGWEAPPGAAEPTSRWLPGTLVRTLAALRLPARLPDGRYRLIAGLFRASDGARLHTSEGADHVTLGAVAVRGRAHTMTLPNLRQPADVRFGDTARLVGYDLTELRVAPGGTLALTLFWQAAGATDRDYTVFVHLLDASGQIRGYGDGVPGLGRLPTTGWVENEYLVDRHEVLVDPAAPGGTYRLAVGLYDPATGLRLRMPDGADRWLLDDIIIVEPR